MTGSSHSHLQETALTGSRQDITRRVALVGMSINIFLTIAQVIGGILTHSQALIADAMHTLSDLAGDIVVLFASHHAGKDADEKHPYGHGRIETLATVVLGLLLGAVAVIIFLRAWDRLTGHTPLVVPDPWAMGFAALAIIGKEGLYHYTVHIAKRINSPMLKASAWHHRSDAFSSIGTLIGISGAFFLGSKWRILDPLASIIVSFFIVKVGYDLIKPALQELLERALPKDVEERIGEIISLTPGVIKFHNLKTRKSGNTYIIDVHIKVDPTITVVEAHDISSDVEKGLRENYGDTTQTSIHIEPYFSKETTEAAASASANDIQ